MTFLAPWALVLGAIAATGAVLLHLVSRQRPAAYVLPTARFIPDQRTLVRRLATRPRDLVLLALRVLVLLAASAAFARPVLAPTRAARARIVLLDRSAAVADPAAALARARTLASDGVQARLILFDRAAVVVGGTSGGTLTALDSLADVVARDVSLVDARDGLLEDAREGSLSAALVAARRLAPAVARGADSVELVLLSPVTAAQLDAATDSIRATWPGAIVIERLPVRAATAAPWRLERAIGTDDVLGPALSGVPVGGAAGAAGAVRLRRTAPGAADSAFARSGGAVIAWDGAERAPLRAEALVAGDDVVVAPLRRGDLRATDGERTIVRWADGAPAAVEARLGEGCVRRVAVGVPDAGDLPLRTAFQRIVRGVMSPCVGVAGGASRGVVVPADAAALARLAGPGHAAAPSAALEGRERPPSPIVPWLLGIALASALVELIVRARPRAGEAA